MMGTRFEDLHRGGWDPDARLEDQVRDGVAAEIIYPTVGMQICNHKDLDYKRACFEAYNRWIGEYCAAHPERLLGAGQTAMRTPAEGIADLHKIKALGLRGVMMPGHPGVEDYDSPAYDDFWEAAVEIGLPLSFHILTTRDTTPLRGPRMNAFLAVIRGCQGHHGHDGARRRLRAPSAPAHRLRRGRRRLGAALHVPHGHAFKRHRNWLPPGQELSKLPSEYFAEHIYTTFQDDWVAFRTADLMNWHRLMGERLPHSDSTWPWSQELLAEHASALTPEQRRAILCDNVADLYGIDSPRC
jgi:predicted TIM-barrel fold metal-dependent hydrolase